MTSCKAFTRQANTSTTKGRTETEYGDTCIIKIQWDKSSKRTVIMWTFLSSWNKEGSIGCTPGYTKAFKSTQHYIQGMSFTIVEIIEKYALIIPMKERTHQYKCFPQIFFMFFFRHKFLHVQCYTWTKSYQDQYIYWYWQLIYLGVTSIQMHPWNSMK